MTFGFEFQLDQPEHVRATRIMYHRKSSTRAMYAFFLLLFLVGVGLYAHDLWLGRTGWLVGLGAIVAAAVGGATAGYLSPYWMVRALRKNNRVVAGPHRYTLHDDGFEVSSPGATSTIEWANIVEAYETREFLLLYLSRGWATFLPKRVVTAEDLPRLRAALRAWVGERAHLLPA